MTTTIASASVVASAQVHASLLEGFIRMAQEKRVQQADVYVVDSLSDLIASLEANRDEYLALIATPALANAA